MSEAGPGRLVESPRCSELWSRRTLTPLAIAASLPVMKLAEKGHFAPRPTLEGVAEGVAAEIDKWTSVHSRTHWELGDETIVDGADFYVGERELGHIHLYAEAHVRVSRPLRDALIAAKLARPFRWSERFVVQRVRTAAEADATEWLFRLAYDHLAGASVASLLDRVAQRALGAQVPAAAASTASAIHTPPTWAKS